MSRISLNIGRFAEKLLKAVKGDKGIVEPSYVYLPGVPGGEEIAKSTGCDYFSVPIELGVSLKSLAVANLILTSLTAKRRRESHQHPQQRQRPREEANRHGHLRPQGQHLQGCRVCPKPSSQVKQPSSRVLLCKFL